MKKTLPVILALLLGISLLAGCGETAEKAGNDTNTPASSSPSSPRAVSGKTHSTGDFSVLVPDGWTAAPFRDSSGAEVSDVVAVYKGDESLYIRGDTPIVQIYFFPEGEGFGRNTSKSMYMVPEDITPIEIGGVTWEGFTAYSEYIGTVVMPFTLIWAAVGDDILQVSVFMPRGERDEIKYALLTDPEISAIISSLKPN